MVAFYTEWLEKDKSIQEAFTTAQQYMQKTYPEPYYWAGFVLVE